MSCLDEALVSSRVAMLNSHDSRRRCENKALAHLAFEKFRIRQPRSFLMSAEGVCDRGSGWDGETIVKPLFGNRSGGIEICDSLAEALVRETARGWCTTTSTHTEATLLRPRHSLRDPPEGGSRNTR
jgi:hypothetical protein